MSDAFSEHDPDMQVLARKILFQAISDYAKLMHPSQRQRVYLREAWWFAIDLLFDDNFAFESLKDDNGEDMTILDFIKLSADRENLSLDKFREYVVEQAILEWQDKELTIMVEDIKDIVVEGVVYAVTRGTPPLNRHYSVDYETQDMLILDKLDRQGFEQAVIMATTEAVCFHKDLRISAKLRDELAESFYQVLRINDAFRTN